LTNVHKDFHGALSYAIEFLEREYGREGLEDFLSGLSKSVYAPLVADIKDRGLEALGNHWERVFGLEGGSFGMKMEGERLVLTVNSCPAISHMRERGYIIAPSFCEHCRIVNEALCHEAGYECDIEYDQAEGRCVQRFWREK